MSGTLDESGSGVGTLDENNGSSITGGTFTDPTISGTMTFSGTVLTSGTLQLIDSTTFVVDVLDTTKRLQFDVGGTTGITGIFSTAFTTAKTITFPDATDTIVGRTTTDTLTNKTLSTPTINGTLISGDNSDIGTSLVRFGAVFAEYTDMALGIITADQPVMNLTVTWNNAGVLFTGIKLNVTDTASPSNSVLLSLRVGDVTKFSVAKTGNIAVTGTSTFSDDITMGDGANFVFATVFTGTKIGTATNQKIGFYNATPVTQRTGLANVVGDADLVYDAEERDMITDLKNKVNGILTRLEELGFFAVA